MIRVHLDIEPVSWSAPRRIKYRMYDPRHAHKTIVRRLLRTQYKGKPLQGYTMVFFLFTFAKPKNGANILKKHKNEELVFPTKKDTTNLQKLYEDCLNKLIIDDDRKVVTIVSNKVWGETDSVTITVFEISPKFDQWMRPPKELRVKK